MELSDETSRSDSSVSLGGGGGSLSGTEVNAGDFLEKNTSCHLGAGRRVLKRLASPSLDLILWQAGEWRLRQGQEGGYRVREWGERETSPILP